MKMKNEKETHKYETEKGKRKKKQIAGERYRLCYVSLSDARIILHKHVMNVEFKTRG